MAAISYAPVNLPPGPQETVNSDKAGENVRQRHPGADVMSAVDHGETYRSRATPAGTTVSIQAGGWNEANVMQLRSTCLTADTYSIRASPELCIPVLLRRSISQPFASQLQHSACSLCISDLLRMKGCQSCRLALSLALVLVEDMQEPVEGKDSMCRLTFDCHKNR